MRKLQKNNLKQVGKKKNFIWAVFFMLIILGFSGCSADADSLIQAGGLTEYTDGGGEEQGTGTTSGSRGTGQDNQEAESGNKSVSDINIPAYSGEAYVEINHNMPYFTEEDYSTESFESYSPLDSLGRCGTAYANIGQDIMPTEEKQSIGQIKPSGWHLVKYDIVEGKYLYNRCHLIGYQLSGENANEQNLITGTRYLNVTGMLPFENKVADYVKKTDHHVLYRVTPIFEGDNLLADGVLMEAWSVEDAGEGICFNVFVYNVQPGVIIDLATGDSRLESEADGDLKDERPEGGETASSGIAQSGQGETSSSGTAQSGQGETSSSGTVQSGQGETSSSGIAQPDQGETSSSESGRPEMEGTVATEGSQTESAGNAAPTETVQENPGLVEEPVNVKDTAQVPEGTDYILNTNTKKFHYPNCSSVGQMAEKNKKAYTGNRDDIINMGYSPCKRCNP